MIKLSSDTSIIIILFKIPKSYSLLFWILLSRCRTKFSIEIRFVWTISGWNAGLQKKISTISKIGRALKIIKNKISISSTKISYNNLRW